MKTLSSVICMIAILYSLAAAGTSTDSLETKGYSIEKPGTITFTVGVKIKGKVEKPEVIIFLPKQKPYFRPVRFDYSFTEDILKPLPFTTPEE